MLIKITKTHKKFQLGQTLTVRPQVGLKLIELGCAELIQITESIPDKITK